MPTLPAAGGTPTPLADQLRATALGDLVDKWFYGTDLPAAVVGTTYTDIAGSLFGDNADQALNVPSSSDMRKVPLPTVI